MNNVMLWKKRFVSLGKRVKENYLIVLVAVNIILLSLFVISYANKVSNLIELEFSQENLETYTGDKCIAGYVDGDYESGLYDIIPDMFLRKGYYTYTVHYEGDSPGSFCWPHTYVEYYDAIEQQTVGFTEGKTEGTRKFWLNVDLNIALRLFYSGEGEVTFTGFSIKESKAQANIELFSRILILLGINGIILLINRQKQKPIENSLKYSIVALLVITAIASSLSLTGVLMEGHDTRFHLARIEGIKEGILAGQFPVRISPVFYNGYGYANSIFYGELFLYFPAFLRLIGFTVIDSYNAYLVAINFLTAFICFYAGRKILADDAIAVTMAMLYTLSPYRLMDMYSRSAIGEVTAMAFLPLVVYGLYRIFTEDSSAKSYKNAYLPLTLGITGIIQSHVLTVEMTAGFILLACVFFCFKTLQKKRFLMLVKTVGITILVNLWFLVPFVDFMLTQDIRIFENKAVDRIQKTGLFFPQLFSLFSDFSLMSVEASEGLASEMTYSMGLPVGLGIALFGVMLLVKKDDFEYNRAKKIGGCIGILAVIAIWMTTVSFPWDRISTMSVPFARMIASLQFVWRFVGVATALAVFVVGFGLVLLKKQEGSKVLFAAVALLASLSLMSGMDFVQDNFFNRGTADITENSLMLENNSYYAMHGEYTLKGHKYEVVTEIWEPRCFEGVEITDYKKKGTNIQFSVENNGADGYVYLPLLNYKGYKVSSEDNVISNDNLEMGEHAEMRINIPDGYVGTISVSYAGFWYWRLAELVTWATLIGLFVFYIKNRKADRF